MALSLPIPLTPHAPPLGALLYPLLAGVGAALALGPIIVHLLLRSKPRLVTFPAMRFVKVTHAANVSKNRLKHILLLLMRMAAIAILALVLARPTIQTAADIRFGSDEPVAAVFVIDTSGSMAYRVADQSRLDEAKRLAERILDDLPAGSRTTVLWADRPESQPPLGGESATRVEIQSLSSRPPQDRPTAPAAYRPAQRATVGPLLERAYKTLADSPLRRREIYLFNDRTRDSWADLAAGAHLARDDVSVVLVDVGAKDNQDFQLSQARWDSPTVSPRRSPALSAKVQAGELTGPRVVELELLDEAGNARVVGRQQVDLPGKLSSAEVDFRIAPLPPGLHACRVRITDRDEIAEDNVRRLALHVGPPPQVLMVESPSAGRAGWSVGDHVEAVLAPPQAVAAGLSLVDLVRVQPAEFLITPSADQAKLNRAQAVILADVGTLGDQQWEALRNYVGSGGTLITLLGPQSDLAALNSPAALNVLPVPGVERRVQPARPGPAAMPPFDKNLSLVLASYRRHDKKPLIVQERVFQYGTLPADKPLPANTNVLIRLAGDDAPLLVERRLGSGHSLMLLTSPLPDWSEWNQQATWVVLMLSMADTYHGGEQSVYHFTQATSARQMGATITVPAAFRAGTAVVTLPDGMGTQSHTIDPARGTVALPTQWVGHYRVQLQSPAGERGQLLYAVNFDPAEFALQKIAPEELATFFASGRLTVIADPSQRSTSAARARSSREEIGALLGLALLLLLIGESFFSNRFYRTAAAGQAAGAPARPASPAKAIPARTGSAGEGSGAG